MKTEVNAVVIYECAFCHDKATFIFKPGRPPVVQVHEAGWKRDKWGWECPKDHRPPERKYGNG